MLAKAYSNSNSVTQIIASKQSSPAPVGDAAVPATQVGGEDLDDIFFEEEGDVDDPLPSDWSPENHFPPEVIDVFNEEF